MRVPRILNFFHSRRHFHFPLTSPPTLCTSDRKGEGGEPTQNIHYLLPPLAREGGNARESPNFSPVDIYWSEQFPPF